MSERRFDPLAVCAYWRKVHKWERDRAEKKKLARLGAEA